LSGCKICKSEQNGDATIVQLGSGNYQFTYASDQFLPKKN